jgi:hypothetical protein
MQREEAMFLDLYGDAGIELTTGEAFSASQEAEEPDFPHHTREEQDEYDKELMEHD